MKRTLLIPFLLIALLTGSCSITQEYHFNKDLSGTYRFEIKMSDLINMMQSMDTTGKAISSLDTLNQSFKKLTNNYKNAGAKNIKIGWKDDKTTIYINFDFENLENLNTILVSSNSESEINFINGNSKTPAKITNKGKRFLSFDFPEFSNDTILLKNIESMKDYINIETIFSFDRKIKSITNKNAIISDDKKSYKFSGKLDNFLTKNFSMDSDVKLKFK